MPPHSLFRGQIGQRVQIAKPPRIDRARRADHRKGQMSCGQVLGDRAAQRLGVEAARPLGDQPQRRLPKPSNSTALRTILRTPAPA